MKAKVDTDGIRVPKELLNGLNEVEIRREDDVVVIFPHSSKDPVFSLGRDPVTVDVTDASVNLDRYL